MRGKGEFVGAVDFGSRRIRVLIARRDEDGTIQVIGHGTAPGRGCVSQGVIQDLGAAKMALKQALAAAEKEARMRVSSLFCGVQGRNCETFIREGRVKIPTEAVERREMDEARDIASRDILAPGRRILSSINGQEWYVDDLRVQDPIGIHGQVLKIRVHFARLPTVIEENLVHCITSQNKELEDTVFLPLATAQGCMTPEDMELGAAVLDMGRSTTSLAVYRDRRIMGAHCFEWGGYHVTRDVAAGLQVSFEEADELILEYGISDSYLAEALRQEQERELEESEEHTDDGAPAEEALPQQPAPSRSETRAQIKLKTAVSGAPSIVAREQLDEIMYERARELLVRVRNHLHSSGQANHIVRGMILTGGASQIRNQLALAESVFQVPCRLGVPDTVEILPSAARTPEFSAAAGIVRHAFEYRNAARNGHAEPRGPLVSTFKRAGAAIRKYFF